MYYEKRVAEGKGAGKAVAAAAKCQRMHPDTL